LSSIKKLNELLDLALSEFQNKPEDGLKITRRCLRFILESMPNSTNNSSRADALRQYENLEKSLALVRQPAKYVDAMKEQFGPNLDPRNYGGGDSFNTGIRSLRQHLAYEGNGFGGQAEKEYNQLRAQALKETSLG